LRNTKVVDLVRLLRSYNTQVDVFDPWIDLAEAEREYGLVCLKELPLHGEYDAIILAVGHRTLVELGPSGIKALGKPGAVIFDVKSVLPAGTADGRL